MDIIEGSRVPERSTGRQPKLLFHGSSGWNNASLRKELIVEHGLLANTLTLSTGMEVALGYARGNEILLTFWYPARSEVRVESGIAQPTTPVPESTKLQMLDQVSRSRLDDSAKETCKDIIATATTILSPSRLGAIATIKLDSREALVAALPSRAQNFPANYANDQEKSVTEIRTILGNSEVELFTPVLSIAQLAEDIVRADLEHHLLSIGKWVSNFETYIEKPDPDNPIDEFTIETWEERLKNLQVHFNEPAYERYRAILVSKIETCLQKARTQ